MNGRAPIESPLDSGGEYERLECMLNDNTSQMILDPTFVDRFCEGHANPPVLKTRTASLRAGVRASFEIMVQIES